MPVFVKRVCRLETVAAPEKLPLHIGILGEAGVGKSTLIAAIARLAERRIEAQRDSGWRFETDGSQRPMPAPSYTAFWRHSVGAVVKWETNRSTCLLHDLPTTSDANVHWLRTDLARLSGAILVLDAQTGFTAATHDLLRLAHRMGAFQQRDIPGFADPRRAYNQAHHARRQDQQRPGALAVQDVRYVQAVPPAGASRG